MTCPVKKNFEISVVETVELKLLLVCVYRSPHSDILIFLDKLETLVDRIQKKKKKTDNLWRLEHKPSPGEWSGMALKNILVSNDLINTVTVPTSYQKFRIFDMYKQTV
jgi:hypothetical protein